MTREELDKVLDAVEHVIAGGAESRSERDQRVHALLGDDIAMCPWVRVSMYQVGDGDDGELVLRVQVRQEEVPLGHSTQWPFEIPGVKPRMAVSIERVEEFRR
jgi:hypothetical protein